MPIYWWPDEGSHRATVRSREVRARDIATVFHQHEIPWDAATLLALAPLIWRAAVELAFRRERTPSLGSYPVIDDA
jgi:hypothetical protein